MNADRPTIADLRARVFKRAPNQGPGSPHAAPGNTLARYWGRPAAVWGTWLAVRCGLSAHAVTVLALASGLGGAAAIGTGTRDGFVAGVALGHLSFWLDHVDGQVARWRGTAGMAGAHLDYLMHHALALATGFALGHGLAMRESGEPMWSVAGLMIGAGWLFLGVENDCRYKAFHQRLKASGGSFLVIGGQAPSRRPIDSRTRPRRGPAWPALKACEPHMVLMGLSVLALVSLAWPIAWLALWKGGVVVMAVLAPVLAIGRIGRTVTRGRVETEFDAWFQPWPPDERGP
jgi:hypothetical protein